jgi:hypothetical protein
VVEPDLTRPGGPGLDLLSTGLRVDREERKERGRDDDPETMAGEEPVCGVQPVELQLDDLTLLYQAALGTAVAVTGPMGTASAVSTRPPAWADTG